VAIRTRLTRMFDLGHPILLAPMGSVSGGLLAASVSNAGGLGLIGGGYGKADWLRRELSIADSNAVRGWGVGLITWSLKEEILDLVLKHRPVAIMLSFGDPRPWGPKIKTAGAKLICQVQDLAGARQALAAGADILVAQGTEAGGHGGQRATFPLVPAVADLSPDVITLAAGGIADGRGLAAALMLGAEGALIGTRFYAATEALASPAAKARIAAANGDDTVRTRVFDIVRNLDWPADYSGRALINRFLRKWHGAENVLADSLDRAAADFLSAQRDEDFDSAMVWAGECVDLIGEVKGAESILTGITMQAEQLLGNASTRYAVTCP
jgi:nitronate monooxygenase